MLAILFIAAASSMTATLPACMPTVCFSPLGHCDAEVVRVLDGAQTSLDLAVYGLNRASIVDAIIRARARGVAVRLIVDKLQSHGQHEREPLARIVASGVPVKRNTRYLMHDKFVISDGLTVGLGSMNWTLQGVERNNENFMVMSCAPIAVEYAEAFASMWAAFPEVSQ